MKWKLLILFLSMVISAAAQPKGAAPKQWHIAATLPPGNGGTVHLGIAGPVAGLHNGALIVGGGANFPDAMPWLGGAKRYHDELFVYGKDDAGKLSLIITARLPFPLAYGASCATPKGIVVAGGETGTTLSKETLLMKWNSKESKVIIERLPQLPVALTNASIATDGRKVYLAGGETATAALNLFLCLDLEDTTKGWQQLPPLPQPTSHAVLAVLQNGKEKNIYLIGGRKKNSDGISELYASVFLFDVNKAAWVQKASLPYPLSAGTGVAANEHSILLFGGDRGETFTRAETLIAAIANEKDTDKKRALNEQKISVQAGHSGFSNKVLHYDAVQDEWSEKGTIPFAVPVTTTAVRWNDCVFIVSGEIKAGVRTPNILAAHL